MATFRRLLGFLRPYRSGVIWSFVARGGRRWSPASRSRGSSAGRSTAIRAGDSAAAAHYAIAIAVAAACCRSALTVARRLVAGKVSLGVEYDLRNRVYAHLLALELGFFDRQQTGQLMSRATVDLQAVRFFLGYGLVFMAQSALTILLAAVAMFLVDPRARRAVADPGAVRRRSSRSATGAARARRRRRSSSGSPS